MKLMNLQRLDGDGEVKEHALQQQENDFLKRQQEGERLTIHVCGSIVQM